MLQPVHSNLIYFGNSKQATRKEQADKWNNISSQWADVKQTPDKDILNSTITYPEMKRVLGNIQGRKVLDLGCGEGKSSRLIAEMGADVTGVDFSDSLIDIAKHLKENADLNIKFYKNPMTNLSDIPSNSMDKVVSIMSFMYLDNNDITGCLKEVKRVLKDDGELIILTKHPFTTRNNISDRTKNPYIMNYKESYFKKSVTNYNLKLGKINETLSIYPQTVSSLYNLIRNNGFTIDEMNEPAPTKNAIIKYDYNPNLIFYNHNPMILTIKAKMG